MGTQLHHNNKHTPWLEPSRPPESRPVVRHHASSSPPRQPASPPPPPAASRSPTVTVQEPWPSVRSGDTRSPPSSSSESSPSSVSSVRSPRTSRPTCASSRRPSVPSRSPPRPTSSRSSKTPPLPPSTPSESPSSQRTFSSPDVCEASDKRARVLRSISLAMRLGSPTPSSKGDEANASSLPRQDGMATSIPLPLFLDDDGDVV